MAKTHTTTGFHGNKTSTTFGKRSKALLGGTPQSADAGVPADGEVQRRTHLRQVARKKWSSTT